MEDLPTPWILERDTLLSKYNDFEDDVILHDGNVDINSSGLNVINHTERKSML